MTDSRRDRLHGFQEILSVWWNLPTDFHYQGVLILALITRVLTVAILIVFDFMLPDHEASGVRIFNCESRLLKPFTRWDAAHLLTISTSGYKYENSHAFFPLFPWIVGTLSRFTGCDVVLVAIFISNGCFILAALILLRLGKYVLHDHQLAFRSALLFCVSPASLFFSTAYTESIFALATFSGMLVVESKGQLVAGILCFMAASATRSNGSMAILFIGAHHALYLCRDLKKNLRMDIRGKDESGPGKLRWKIAWCGVRCMVLSVATMLPCIAFGIYGYSKLCIQSQTSSPDVCASYFVYANIQHKYWNVGFLRYWEVKQFPNFMLATPAFIIFASALRGYLREVRKWCLTSHLTESIILSSLTPYMVHSAASMFIMLFFAHVQVTTRVISASGPVLYWQMTELLTHPPSKTTRPALTAFLVVYTTIGPLLHSNFYPWT